MAVFGEEEEEPGGHLKPYHPESNLQPQARETVLLSITELRSLWRRFGNFSKVRHKVDLLPLESLKVALLGYYLNKRVNSFTFEALSGSVPAGLMVKVFLAEGRVCDVF